MLSVAGFAGADSDVDVLRPVFEKLEGVVVLTALQSSDDEMASLISEVTHDFCVDAQRVITSSVPLLGVPPSPEPERPVTSDMKLATEGSESPSAVPISDQCSTSTPDSC